MPTIQTNLGESFSAECAEQIFALLRADTWFPEPSLPEFAHALARRASMQVGADIEFTGDYEALLNRLEEVSLLTRLEL